MMTARPIPFCLALTFLAWAAPAPAQAEPSDTAAISVTVTVQSFSEFSFEPESKELTVDEEAQSSDFADFVGELRGNISVTLHSAIDGPGGGGELIWSAGFVVGDGTEQSVEMQSGRFDVTFRLAVTRNDNDGNAARSFTLQTTGPIGAADAGIQIDDDDSAEAGQATITITPDD